MNNDLTISLIIPVYNVEDFVGECLDSVIEQTYKKLEILIINDGSTDNSKKICESYKENDKRIQIINQKNGGLSAARNTGMKYATGNWIFFLDSDDVLERSALEKLVKLSIQEDSDIVISRSVKFKNISQIKKVKDERLKYKNCNTQESLDLYFYRKLSGYSWGKLIKKNLIDNGFKFPVGKLYEDVYTTPELFIKANQITITNILGVFYRQRNGSIVNSKFSTSKLDILEADKKWINYFQNNYKILNAVYSHSFFNIMDLITKFDKKQLGTYYNMLLKSLNVYAAIIVKNKDSKDKKGYVLAHLFLRFGTILLIFIHWLRKL
ncbi:glycosyltransferase family 2 protein [uncultured Dubosiella sp.]|uniref:glycosyltransferase family 2 protein n=2 Tax=uncultured Dubosiella sp. TaxID=1937011 RepID=UPI002634DC29|nr:glycosyltransferase family 2 protein [uncultured Dubosiella sp.]